MKYPSLREYQLAVQNPTLAFRNDPVLRGGVARTNLLNLPTVASGGFAATFRIDCGGRQWAVRCFHRSDGTDRGLLHRYGHIDAFITGNSDLDFLVPVKYLDDGIIVNGNTFPTVRMQWVDGLPLGVWLEDWAEAPDPHRIDTVRRRIREAVAALRARDAAHGDLQHGNILVRPDDKIWLIDYDGMFLRNLAGLDSIEQGHRNYQHPDRGRHYGADLDVFAAECIDLSLAALARDPSLWKDFGGTGENLLFESTDFANPDSSQLFTRLSAMPEISASTRKFRAACLTEYSQIGAALAGRSTLPTADGHVVSTALIFAAEDAAVLRDMEGQPVTVVGTVTWTKIIETPRGAVALINLGDYKKGDFTIVAYGDVVDALHKQYPGRTRSGDRYLRDVKGLRVAINGTITLYDSDYSSNLTPQIELDRAGLLRILDDDQFRDLTENMHRTHRSTPASPRNSPPTISRATLSPPQQLPKPAPAADRTTARNAALHDLYKNKTGAARKPPQPPATTPRPVPRTRREPPTANQPYNGEPATPAARPTESWPPPPNPPPSPRMPLPQPMPQALPLQQRTQSHRRRGNGRTAFALVACATAAVGVFAAMQRDEIPAPVQFQSPSENVACQIAPDGPEAGVRCDAQEFTYIPPDPAGCADPGYGRTITLTQTSAGFVCTPDTLSAPERPILPLGETKTAGPYTCTSEDDGIACRDNRPGGHRFKITRDAYELE
ncbi:hypothetical protein HLB23_24315 [Nocardia uniformis]|uniref:Protein kinase domain-containing protein n=1 Tax=Nocardia uniformis TaxID=53432 RepID=A0A849C9H2_9NOCA|nr:lipopolysaccharide kinase InaA family protein [Nocardia uniformis]NNH72945.1 hypothetical protein [Nocardia uniformis]